MNLDNTKILNRLKELNNGGELPPLLLSVSGGMDSMVMLYLFLKIKNQYNFDMFVSHINYQNHEKAFYAEKMVIEYCTQYKIPFEVTKINLNINSNFEANARNFRYKIFNNLVNKNKLKYICTAHHWDDQLETLYMKNVQNAPLTSFRGILEHNKNIWRPFLEYKKIDILKYAKKNKVNWIEDSTNIDKKYFRNMVRIEEIPKLKRENKKLIQELFLKKKTAHNLFKSINKIKLELLKSNKLIINTNPFYYKIEISSLNEFKEINKKLIIQTILNDFNIDLQSMTILHWKTFWQFIKIGKTGKEFKLYENIRALIDRNSLIFYHHESIVAEKFKIKDNLKWYNSKFKLNYVKTEITDHKQCFHLDWKSIKNGIYVRNWKHGDTLIDKDLNKNKKISDIFIKNKISRFHKMIHPIIVDSNDNPIWVPNLWHNNCNSKKNNKNIILKWQQN